MPLSLQAHRTVAAKTSWWCATANTRPAWCWNALLGEFQTVIKPLGKVFNLIRGIGGFTILGSSKVALILDVPGLMRQVMTAEEPVDTRKHLLAVNQRCY
jgi:chemotaxis protein histidine kinase CheA